MKLFALLFMLSCFARAIEVPSINLSIIEYVDQVKGHQVGKGECWDLAAMALDFAGAHLDRSSQESIYVFGRRYDPAVETVYPGDIIQFEEVQLEYQQGDRIVFETMSHHTAIVYEVLEQDLLRIAHQNTRFSGRKVGISMLNLTHVKDGQLLFYRPIAKK